MGRLSDLPFYGTYNERRRQIQDEGMDELKQVGVLSQLAERRQASELANAQRTDALQRQRQMESDRATLTPEQFAQKYASADALLREQNRPERNPPADNRPEVLRLTEALETMPADHPARAPIERRLEALGPRPVAEPRPAAPSQVGRLIAERNALPPNDPNRKVYDAAIQRETHTAQQLNGAGSVAPPGGGDSQANLIKRLGKPPVNHRWKADGSGEAEPIPGGPEDRKLQGKANSTEVKIRQAQQKAQAISEKVDEALGKIGWSTTGLPSYVNIRGTDTYDLGQALNTIKANLGFQELQQMREASPTGGALGQVAVQELMFLQQAVQSLDQGQKPETLSSNLQRVRTHFNNWKSAVERANSPEQPAATPPGAPTAPAAAPAVGFDADKERRYQEWKKRQGK
jgi:hypothetical protein